MSSFNNAAISLLTLLDVTTVSLPTPFEVAVAGLISSVDAANGLAVSVDATASGLGITFGVAALDIEESAAGLVAFVDVAAGSGTCRYCVAVFKASVDVTVVRFQAVFDDVSAGVIPVDDLIASVDTASNGGVDVDGLVGSFDVAADLVSSDDVSVLLTFGDVDISGDVMASSIATATSTSMTHWLWAVSSRDLSDEG